MFHDGVSSSHIGGELCLTESHRPQGYLWSSLRKEAEELVRKCDICQRHGNGDPRPRRRPEPSNQPVAFRYVGRGHCRASIVSSSAKTFPTCGHRLLHKVDGGRGFCSDKGAPSTEIHLEKYH